MEKLGVPTVYLTTSQFLEDARFSAEDNGVPKLRIIGLPADIYYSERITKERAKPVAEAALEEMIDLLERPITDEEKQPKEDIENSETVQVSGEDVIAAVENLNQLFIDNEWADGLPVLPPTKERVQWMLTGTDRSPEEEIGTISPRNGMATIEKIAINAVMAGAKPEYLPVIIAIVEGLADERFDELHFLTSTGSFNLVITVSGPIVKEIGMNPGLGLWSYGNRANSTIGRAVRLAMINIGHLWPGVNDMALVGRASPHTFLVIAENQDFSPWESYHVSQGFKSEDSCVTLDVVGGYSPGGRLSFYGGGAVALVSPEDILESVIERWTEGRGPQRNILILNPEIARELNNRLGYTRESLQAYLAEQTKVTPENSHIIVAGGIPGYTISLSGYQQGIYKPLAHITKLVTGSTLTNAGSVR
ncbi:MAG: hypothetical protein P8Z37_08300 [Acidobacteriota bacterium]